MLDLISFFIASLMSFFAIMNPLGVLPVFMTMGNKVEQRELHRMAGRAALVTAFTLILFAFLGSAVLSFFKVTPHAFKVVAGLNTHQISKSAG